MALDALEECRRTGITDWDLPDVIRAELARPEPVVIGWVEVINGVLTYGWSPIDLPIGKCRLLAERIDDATPE